MENTNNIFEQKEALRRETAERVAALDPAEKAERDGAALRELSALPELRAASCVFCYVSMDGEVDTRRLIPALINSGRRVLVPRIDGDEMVAVEINSMDELTPGAFGIPEPPKELPAVSLDEIEFALIPGVAFGADGTRLGRGKGYYDRWLAAYGGTKCAVVRENELLETVPAEPHDERMNMIVTDERVVRISTAEKTIESFIETSVARSMAKADEEDDELSAPAGMTESGDTTPPEEPVKKTAKTTEEAEPKRRLGCMGAVIWLLCVIGISAALAGFGWLAADDVLSLTSDDSEATVVVLETDEVSDVAEKLGEAGMIKHPWLFEFVGKLMFEAEERIAPGVYEVNDLMDYRALINAMRTNSAYRATVDVTIPEGYTVEQILQRLADNGVNTYENLADTAANYDFEYTFLEDRPLGDVNRLEGYLFPNTHTFYIGESPVNVLNRLLNDFSAKFDEELRADAEELGYSMHEVLTIASLIEKEAASRAEMPVISSVIHNRLNNWDSPKLQIDATIQYVLEERKEFLSNADLEIDSPYNTYQNEGLPPGPICNPGLASIKAALAPEETNYYFYALTEDGTHAFARTAEEHQAIIDANPGAYGGR